jgi:hypothetical protein
MLYREIIAACSEIHTKHINTLCGQNVEFFIQFRLILGCNPQSRQRERPKTDTRSVQYTDEVLAGSLAESGDNDGLLIVTWHPLHLNLQSSDNAVSSSEYAVYNGLMNCKGCGRMRSWFSVRQRAGMCLERQRSLRAELWSRYLQSTKTLCRLPPLHKKVKIS